MIIEQWQVYWICFWHAASIKVVQCVYLAQEVLFLCKRRIREIHGILLRKLVLMCEVCKKRNGDLRQCMRCNGCVCLEHWFRCGDPKCSPYYRICLKCQRESRFALWRTKDPKSIWVCQNCAKEVRHSQNYMCDLCGEHYESLRTWRSCNRRVCEKDYFWCSVRSCSYSHCRNCNEDSPRDIQKTDGISKNSKKHYHQHWKRRESGKAQAHTKTINSKKHFHQRSKRRKT